MTEDPDAATGRLAGEALARDDPTGWFERLYVEAAAGQAAVPWDRDEPEPLLVDWTRRRYPDGATGRALVVGCGLGRDAEHVASLGFDTIAFDIAESAIRGARERFPASAVDYVVADLLSPPGEWAGGFDFVVESITVQALPPSLRPEAIARVRAMVAPGGELVVISGVREDGEQVDGPPWPLTRAELGSFAAGDVQAARLERLPRPDVPGTDRWRAVFRRLAP
jgi:SAM-dependent methyltransferase